MSSDTADLIVYLARLAQMPQPGSDDTARPALTAAQWTALRYFARANRFSRTPSAFSEFHATTRGTASQTVKSLVTLGLLAKATDPADARQTLIDVTPQGREMLRDDPLSALRDALQGLSADDRAALGGIIGKLVAKLAARRDAPVFGSCSDCTHCEDRLTDAYCHCTQSALSLPEKSDFCVDFQPLAVRR